MFNFGGKTDTTSAPKISSPFSLGSNASSSPFAGLATPITSPATSSTAALSQSPPAEEVTIEELAKELKNLNLPV